MATAIQRSGTILDAALNSASTLAQRQRLLAAYKVFVPDGTTEDIAQVMVRDVLNLLRKRVQEYESGASYNQAKKAAEDQVVSDFSETP